MIELKLKEGPEETKKNESPLRRNLNDSENSNLSYNAIEEPDLVYVKSRSLKIPTKNSNSSVIIKESNQLKNSRMSFENLNTSQSKNVANDNFDFKNYFPTQIPESWKFLADTLKKNDLIIESLKIYTVTWNMKGQIATKEEVKMILSREKNSNTKLEKNNFYDLYVIGTQECMRSILKSFFNSNKDDWIKMLQSELEEEYILIKSETLSAMNLTIFAHKRISQKVSKISSDTIKTGIANMVGNKGAVGISFNFGGKSFLFLNSHLAAGHSAFENRNKDFLRINTKFTIGDKYANESSTITDQFDAVIWLGDFNYRVEMEIQKVIKFIKNNELEALLEHDQLLKEISLKRIHINNFTEGLISFYPTYKHMTGQGGPDNFNISERIPSYTDRILFKSRNSSLSQIKYDSISTTSTSDHKPVYSVFKYDFINESKNIYQEGKYNKSKFCIIY